MILDFALLDSIRGVFMDDGGELWKALARMNLHAYNIGNGVLLTLDTHIGNCFVKVLKATKEDDLESKVGLKVRVEHSFASVDVRYSLGLARSLPL